MAEKTYKFVCTVCGYEVEVDTPELPEEEANPHPDAHSTRTYTPHPPQGPAQYQESA